MGPPDKYISFKHGNLKEYFVKLTVTLSKDVTICGGISIKVKLPFDFLFYNRIMVNQTSFRNSCNDIMPSIIIPGTSFFNYIFFHHLCRDLSIFRETFVKSR